MCRGHRRRFCGLAAATPCVAVARGDRAEARDRVGAGVWSVPFGRGCGRAGRRLIRPGYDTMNALARVLRDPAAAQGNAYGRRVPVGEEAVSEGARGRLDALAGGVGGPPQGLATPSPGCTWKQPSGADRTRARLERRSPRRTRGLGADEGRRPSRLQQPHLEGGHMRLAEALAVELGAAVHLPSPVAEGALVAGRASLATDRPRSRWTPSWSRSPQRRSAEIEFDPPPRARPRSAARGHRRSELELFLRRAHRRRRADHVVAEPSGPTRSWAGWWVVVRGRLHRTMSAIDALGGRRSRALGAALVSLCGDLDLEPERAMSRAGTTTLGAGLMKVAPLDRRSAMMTWPS